MKEGASLQGSDREGAGGPQPGEPAPCGRWRSWNLAGGEEQGNGVSHSGSVGGHLNAGQRGGGGDREQHGAALRC